MLLIYKFQYYHSIIRQSLVSLDLSSNHFDDLKDLVVNKFKKLEKLKSLILYGNPISVNYLLLSKFFHNKYIYISKI
jgi:hypothetical protein